MRLHPVLHVQSRHAGELAHVVGDEDAAAGDGVRGDEGIVLADGGAFLEQLALYFGAFGDGGSVQRGNFIQAGNEIPNALQHLFGRARADGAVEKFNVGDGGNGD